MGYLGSKQRKMGYIKKNCRLNIICEKKRQQRTTDGKMGLESASDIYRDRVKMGKVQQT